MGLKSILLSKTTVEISLLYGRTPVERKREKKEQEQSNERVGKKGSKEGNLNKALFMRHGSLRPAH